MSGAHYKAIKVLDRHIVEGPGLRYLGGAREIRLGDDGEAENLERLLIKAYEAGKRARSAEIRSLLGAAGAPF